MRNARFKKLKADGKEYRWDSGEELYDQMQKELLSLGFSKAEEPHANGKA